MIPLGTCCSGTSAGSMPHIGGHFHASRSTCRQAIPRISSRLPKTLIESALHPRRRSCQPRGSCPLSMPTTRCRSIQRAEPFFPWRYACIGQPPKGRIRQRHVGEGVTSCVRKHESRLPISHGGRRGDFKQTIWVPESWLVSAVEWDGDVWQVGVSLEQQQRPCRAAQNTARWRCRAVHEPTPSHNEHCPSPALQTTICVLKLLKANAVWRKVTQPMRWQLDERQPELCLILRRALRRHFSL